MRKRDLWMVLGAVGAALLLGAGILRGAVMETGSWGLSFPQPGQAPVGNARGEELARYDAAYMGNPAEKVLYLTFDAGYENGNTEKILDVLKEKQVPACFFLVGNYLEQNGDLVRRMVSEGHTVGNHTLHHRDMSQLSREEFQRELTGLEDKFRQVTGEELPKFYRPPQGIYSQDNLRQAQELGYRTVFWSLAYVDWNNDDQPSPEEAFARLLPRTHKGAVVLLHSTSRTNGEILGELLDRWTAEGYRFGTLEELFSGG